MSKEIDELKEELNNKIDISIDKRCSHTKPSKWTEDNIKKLDWTMQKIQDDIREIKNMFCDFRKELKESYVSKTEFRLTVSPIQKLVYGMVGTVLTAVLIAVLYLVIR